MMLAQQTLDALPDSFWKNFCIGLLVVLGAAATIALLIQTFRKPAPVELNDKPAIEVRKAPKRYNHDLTELRFVKIESTVATHGADIEKIKDLFRADLPAMERRLDDANESRSLETHKRINEILSAVGELRGEMKGKK